ncbi:DUF4178 domain-containing protein [Sphingomonas sp.]|uniref:DUF4178 domain-containing protein n=1 Tax=Sphingomonas sp. TaxID=28214 RepID=UPI001D272AEF|nr:DUF4178 domain-containing protein [Sphingomonas sp.]MBX9797284.1 DUF4178 domain-containing protein [Sphingomonas sp.]
MPPDATPATAAPAPAVKALSCPNCGGTITLRAAGYTVTVACQYCGSLLDVTNPEVRLIEAYHNATAELSIPLGMRGVLDGVEWEAVGHMTRSEGGAYPWEEYLLFNPYHGYRWLTFDGRGWSLGTMLTTVPAWSSGSLSVDGRGFTPFFAKTEAQVDSVVGEFYWRVRQGERVESETWVSPGFMLSREANAQEASWTVLRLLTPAEIKAAFGVDAPANPWPPLPHQPSPYGGWLGKATGIAMAAMAFLVVVMLVFSGGTQLASTRLSIDPQGRDQSATIGPITLTRAWQKVEISADVPQIDNGWVDLDYSLVDRKTQQSYDAYGAAERYSGRDSDGPWQEGSGTREVSIASVPAGTYDLVIDYKANRWADPAQSVFGSGPAWFENGAEIAVTARSGGMFAGNLLLAFGLIFLPFLWFLYRQVSFEQARQDQGDFGRSGIAKLLESQSTEDDE